jgi:hypothetical protein
MLLTELHDDPLKELELQMTLRSTDSHVSQAQAEKTLTLFRNAVKVIGGAQKGPISFYLDKKIGTLRIPNSSLPAGWRSGSSAMTRHRILNFLKDHGYKVANWPSDAQERVDYFSKTPQQRNNGPHIYFW